jgi:hypothetical protein
VALLDVPSVLGCEAVPSGEQFPDTMGSQKIRFPILLLPNNFGFL